MDIFDQIKALYGGFNKTKKRISDGILTSTAKCCFLSLREFAAAMDVTEATVLNYCRSLGLDSYVELRRQLQAHMLNAIAPVERLTMAAKRSGSAEDLWQEVVKSEREALKVTFEQNSVEKVLAVCRCIRRARRVFVAAHNASQIPGSYLVRRLLPLGVDISILNLEDKHHIFACLTACPAKEALVIAIAVPTYGKSTLAVVEYCKQVGVPVAAITDSASSPLAQGAEAALICQTAMMELTNSATSLLAAINLLTMLYSFENEERGPEEGQRVLMLSQQFDTCFPD